MVDYVYWLEDKPAQKSTPLYVPAPKMLEHSKIKFGGLNFIVPKPMKVGTTHKAEGSIIERAISIWKDPELVLEPIKSTTVTTDFERKQKLKQPVYLYRGGIFSNIFDNQKIKLQDELLKNMETPESMRRAKLLRNSLVISSRRQVIRSDLEGDPSLASLLNDKFEPYAYI